MDESNGVLLKLTNISKSFSGVPVLKNVDLDTLAALLGRVVRLVFVWRWRYNVMIVNLICLRLSA